MHLRCRCKNRSARSLCLADSRSAVKGVNGLVMQDFFDPEPQVYLGVAAPGFPNYFVINGVRGNWAAGTVLVSVSFALVCPLRRRLADSHVARGAGELHCGLHQEDPGRGHQISRGQTGSCGSPVSTHWCVVSSVSAKRKRLTATDEWHKNSVWNDACKR